MKRIYVLTMLVGLLMPSLTYATDGYFGVGYGAQNKGLAGAGIAWYKNSLINGNPAAHVLLGKQYQLGVGFFNPNRQYTVAGNPSMMPGTMGLMPGTVESDSKLFVVPNIGANWMLNEKSSLSAVLFGNGGMNTNYPAMTFGDQSSSTTGVDLAQMFLGVTYSRKLSEKHSLGLTVLGTYQYFEAKGLGMFGEFGMSSNPEKLTGNGHDNSFGVGLKIGYLGQLTDALSVGASYQPKINMSTFDEYAGLFAEQGDFDIPENFTIGLAYQVNDKLTAMFDYKRINYSGVASIANPIDPMALPPAFMNPDGSFTPNPNHVPLGADNGSGFGWQDINVYKLGLEYDKGNSWVFRGGFSHNDQPIPESEVIFNMLAPGVIENHISLGCSKAFGESGRAIHLAMVYALPASVKGYNPFDFDPEQAMQGNMVPNQTIELEMNQFELEIAFTF
ncbi:outer membrane protein transport protein [Carboxylicivirga sediminis]|uniref:Outer membrane protein transport protein n=1 Tax=Carboxylicivirga sediminis TaxID=2006564 RepID=A0A941F2E6_9BACT|nr:outer membrane protein transport protein [Carboxylicivirga sediminis]MBR8535044.1 outer membrane protein transport protein [Carboxylicivirga sediminis]